MILPKYLKKSTKKLKLKVKFPNKLNSKSPNIKILIPKFSNFP